METQTIHPHSATAIVPPYGRCCAGAGPFEGPAAEWLLASHEADHDPSSVVLLPRRQAHRLAVTMARGAGWARGFAPELQFDLAVAAQLLNYEAAWRCSEVVLPHSLLVVAFDVAERAAEELASTLADDAVVDELDRAASELWAAITTTRTPPWERELVQVLAPRVHPPVAPAVRSDLARALQLLGWPPQTGARPAPSGDGQLGGQLEDLVAELATLPRSLADLIARLRGTLRRIEIHLSPSPVIDRTTVVIAAEQVRDLRLAGLRCRRIAEGLEVVPDGATARWAAAESRGLAARLGEIVVAATSVLDVLRPEDDG